MKEQEYYIRENYLKKIRPFYSDDLIKVLTGIRRCGKSSIMHMIAEELKQSGVKEENIVFLNLDQRPYLSIHKPEQLDNLIEKKFHGIQGEKYLFIDEIQNIKGYEIIVNGYREEGDYSIFITGSNSYLLSGELMTKLTGRYLEFEILPLSFHEYLEMKKQFHKPLKPTDDENFLDYILEGGFPHAVFLDSTEAKQMYTQETIQEIFEKDIRHNKKIRKKAVFEKIQDYIINNFGATTSLSSLSRYLDKVCHSKVRKETIYNYLSILENAKIVSRCSRFDLKSKISLQGEEKYYLTDLSFYFSRNVDNRINYGPVLENIVYNYAKSQGMPISIGKIGNLEVDFILRNMDRSYAYVQVARTIMGGEENQKGISLTEEREYRPLEAIRDNYPKYVLTMDHLLQRRNGIHHENIVEFLKGEKSFS